MYGGRKLTIRCRSMIAAAVRGTKPQNISKLIKMILWTTCGHGAMTCQMQHRHVKVSVAD